MLPGMSGPELARTIAKIDPGLPTVFMSGYSDGELTDQGHVPADTTLLTKPFPAADLTRTVGDPTEGLMVIPIPPAAETVLLPASSALRRVAETEATYSTE